MRLAKVAASKRCKNTEYIDQGTSPPTCKPLTDVECETDHTRIEPSARDANGNFTTDRVCARSRFDMGACWGGRPKTEGGPGGTAVPTSSTESGCMQEDDPVNEGRKRNYFQLAGVHAGLECVVPKTAPTTRVSGAPKKALPDEATAPHIATKSFNDKFYSVQDGTTVRVYRFGINGWGARDVEMRCVPRRR